MTTAEVPNLVGHSPKFGYLSLIGCCIPHLAAVEKKIKTETTAEALRRFRIIARCQALWRGYVVRRAQRPGGGVAGVSDAISDAVADDVADAVTDAAADAVTEAVRA